jgi:phosphoenolpyruvate carboxykinase (GTP)
VRHWLNVVGRARPRPIFAHVNWFQRDDDGRFLWPGYGHNLRALLWLLDLARGRARGRETPVGIIPMESELNLEGLSIDRADLARLLSYDAALWRPEMESRHRLLSGFGGLPEEIWEAHRRLAAAVGSD